MMDDKKLETSVTANSSPSSTDSSLEHSDNEYLTHDGHEQIDIEHLHDEEPTRPSLVRVRSNRSYASGAEGYADITLQREKSGLSLSRTQTSDPAFEVDWEEDDAGNPKNWSLLWKSFIIFVFSFATSTVVLYSTSYTSAIPGLVKDFGISETTGNLGLTTYLIGMAVGSVILAPLSEMYGRRIVYIIALGLFVILVLPCALATNIEAILITRFFGAFCASALISNAPGTINDIVTEKYRALAFSIWSIGPMNGPVIGPVVGGFVYQYLGWRWTNWVVIIVSGIAFVLVALIPETYAPTLLRRRAAKLRKDTNNEKYWSTYDDRKAFWPLLRVNLSRPFVLMVTEPILIFWDVYVAIVYGVLYLCFVAYPIVFSEIRGWSYGISGLAFCGIGTGTLILIVCEPLIRKWIDSHAPDPETGAPPPEAMVAVIALGAVLLAVGEIWFAWTCTPEYHWAIPICSGVLFGAGNSAVFIYASNYLVHSYNIYAASALAGNAVLRSLMGATLPLAGPALYSALGPNWAGTLLGLIEAACIPIPVVFYLYGSRIRAKSPLIRQMQEDKRRQEEKKERNAARSGVAGTGTVEEVVLPNKMDVEQGGIGAGAGGTARDVEKEAVQRGEAEAFAGAGMRTGAAVAEEEGAGTSRRRGHVAGG